MLGSSDFTDMAEVLGGLVKSRTHAHVFCSTLQLAIWYKAVASENKKERASTGEETGKCGSESVKRKSINLWPAFEIENSALHLIFGS